MKQAAKKRQTTTVSSAPAVWTGLAAIVLIAIVAFVAMGTKPAKPVADTHKPDTSPSVLQVNTSTDLPLGTSAASALQQQPGLDATRSIPELSAGVDASNLGAPSSNNMQAGSNPLQGSTSNPSQQ